MRPTPLGLALAAAAISAGAAHAQLHLALPYAYLWDRPGFHGRAITIAGGSDNLAGQHLVRGAVSGTFEGDWTICDRPHLEGRCASVHGKIADVARAGLAGRIMSLKVERPGR